MRHVCSSLLFVACLANVSLGHQARSAEIDFQAASRTHHVDGDLQAAIRKYEAVIREYPTEQRLTAQALLGLAECYETLGDPRARETLERVVREFSDVRDVVAKARTRLSRIPRRAVGVINRQVWTGPDVDANGSVSEDGRYLSFVDWSSGNLAVRELASGTIRRLTNKGPGKSRTISQKTVRYQETVRESPTRGTTRRRGVRPSPPRCRGRFKSVASHTDLQPRVQMVRALRVGTRRTNARGADQSNGSDSATVVGERRDKQGQYLTLNRLERDDQAVVLSGRCVSCL